MFMSTCPSGIARHSEAGKDKTLSAKEQLSELLAAVIET